MPSLEGDESEFADPGLGALTDDDDKDDGEEDFTGHFWGCVLCCSIHGINHQSLYEQESVAGSNECRALLTFSISSSLALRTYWLRRRTR